MHQNSIAEDTATIATPQTNSVESDFEKKLEGCQFSNGTHNFTNDGVASSQAASDEKMVDASNSEITFQPEEHFAENSASVVSPTHEDASHVPVAIKEEVSSPVDATRRKEISPVSSDDEVIGLVARKKRKLSKSPSQRKDRLLEIKKNPTSPKTHQKIETKTETPKFKSSVSAAAVPSGRQKRYKMTEANFEPLNRWWEKDTLGKKAQQWHYLEHKGIRFSPTYVPLQTPVKYAGHEYLLPPKAEEIAGFWVRALETNYAEKKKFVSHFWDAFVKALDADHPILTGLDDESKDPNEKKRYKPKFELCDFTQMKQQVDQEKEMRQAKTKEEKLAEKTQRDQEDTPYRYALFDWIREKVGAFRAEPPSLFKGRGEHPKMGLLKKRILPMEVTLNCAEEAPVPKVEDVDGQCWKDVIHQESVAWLAYYKDGVNGTTKYVFPAGDSAIVAQKDHAKYEKARKLKSLIGTIREDYQAKMKKGDTTEKQLATATYLIDRLALRVGGEKDTDEEADTVGCCSLRVEHMSFTDEDNQLTLDFLGKDSIRYFQTVSIDNVGYENLKSFCAGKKKDQPVFDEISVAALNRYLRDFMEGLSAKVFRTYNASYTLQEELRKLGPESTDVDISNTEDLFRFYSAANREVAILCNHQRSVPKQHESSMEKMQQQLATLDAEIERHEEIKKWLQNPKKTKIKLTEAEEKKKWSEEKISKKIGQLVAKRKVLGWRMQSKDDNKTIASTTSKQHYMDPRITVAFAKQYELKVEKLFNTSLRQKFPWAMHAQSNFEW